MTAGPEVSPEPVVESIATDPASVAPDADITLPVADVPSRVPTLEGRWVRARTVLEVRTRFLADGETETRLFRREGAALGYAARLRHQGYPVAISRGTITWESKPKRRPVQPPVGPPAEPITEQVDDEDVAE